MKKVNAATKKALYNPEVPYVDKENIEKNLKNKDWEDMDNYYNEILKMIVESGESIKTLLNSIQGEVSSFITDEESKELYVLSKGYSTDLNNISIELDKVHKSHIGKKGKPQDETDELFFLISTLEAYISIYDKTLALLTPHMTRMVEIVGEAHERYQKSKIDIVEGAANV